MDVERQLEDGKNEKTKNNEKTRQQVCRGGLRTGLGREQKHVECKCLDHALEKFAVKSQECEVKYGFVTEQMEAQSEETFTKEGD